MSQSPKPRSTQTDHLCWILVSLGAVLALLLTNVAWAEAPLQGSLPVCPKQYGYAIAPSPSYDQDHVLFLSKANPLALWRSNDGGHTWNNVVNLSSFHGISAGEPYLVQSPPDPEYHIYLPWVYNVIYGPGSFFSMLWYSNDSGVTWDAREPCRGDCTFGLSLTNDSDMLFGLEHSSYSWPSSGIWRNDSGGVYHWTKVWNGTEAGWLAVAPDFAQNQTIYASLRAQSPDLGSPVIVSTNGGESWQGAGGDDLCNEGAGSVQVSSAFTEDHTLFVHQASSLFRSQDAGGTWDVIFPRDRPHCQPGVLAPTADSYKLSSTFGQDHTIYMVTTFPSDNDHRLLVSSDGGATWTFQSRVSRSTSLLWVLPAAAGSTGGNEVQSVAPNPLPTALDGAGSFAGAYRATVPESQWTTFLPRVDWTTAPPITRPFTLFIDAWNGIDGWSYYRSDDGGVTWACMQLPTVQPPARTPVLGRGR